jgi:hypothetical protein
MMAAPQIPNAYPDLITVLVLIGLPAGPVHRELSRHAIDSSPDGIMVNVVDDLARLPRYNDTLETHGTPDAVVALRMAATEAMRCSSSRAITADFPRLQIGQSTG